MAPVFHARMPTIASSFSALTGLIFIMAGWTGLELYLGSRTSRASLNGGSRQAELLISVSTVAALLLALLASSAIPAAVIHPTVVAYGAGIAMLLVGITIRGLAASSLGAYYTLELGTQADQTIRDQGLYRWVRHPGYAGTLLALLGVGFALGSWAAALAFVLVVPGLVARIRSEEQMLNQAFGQAYAKYCGETPCRLIPGVL
jgi:protein-S-isoprenylcysteine O-methyltransferase Ste14